jgi:hypothetical protein
VLLQEVGEQAAHAAGRALGPDALARARALWEKLDPALKARPAAQEAAHDVAADPDDEDARAALRLQLKKLLTDDPALASQLAQLIGSGDRTVNVTASGERAVALGGGVVGSTIITGDQPGPRRPRR